MVGLQNSGFVQGSSAGSSMLTYRMCRDSKPGRVNVEGKIVLFNRRSDDDGSTRVRCRSLRADSPVSNRRPSAAARVFQLIEANAGSERIS